MAQPNLSVFICGTYADLRDERSGVMDAVRRMHFQSGSMELFGARPEAPIDVCLAEVRRSDVLVVIVGDRYGTAVPGTRGTSFTEAEYEEGFRLGKSSFVYIRADDVRVLPAQFERDNEKRKRLDLFRQKLEERHTVYRFHDVTELALQVTVDLNRSMAKTGTVESALEIIRRGVDAWNAWRSAHDRIDPDLVRVDLSGLVLEGYDFSGLNLSGATFQGSQLRGSRFEGSNLRFVNFREADVRLVQFDGADLSGADLRGSDVSGASLVNSTLSGALLINTNLSESDVSGSQFHKTVFAMSDLSDTKGLDQCLHDGPSSIDFASLIKAPGIPDVFLSRIGLPELVIRTRSAFTAAPIEFYSCFLSYSTSDQDFAERLHADLQSKGVRCWFAPNDIRAGKKIYEQIDDAIRVYDRLILILSQRSIHSEWVQTEIARARKRELSESRHILFPIRLIPFSEIVGWKCFDAYTGRDSAREIREYYIPDFSDWKNHESYKKAFDSLLQSLRSGDH